MEIYHQGICALTVAEACGMTDRALAAELRPGLEKAVRLILQAQRTAAGPHRADGAIGSKARTPMPA